jgi:hypothetical protein
VVKTGDVARSLEGQARSYASHMQSAAAAAGTLSQGGNAPHGGLVGLSLGQFAEATQGQAEIPGRADHPVAAGHRGRDQGVPDR